MVVQSIFFYLFSFIAIVSAIMVTVSRNTVHSVFFLILDFVSISCLFIMGGAEFLGMIMLIVYVGAVAVLFLFVVMMLNVAQQENEWFQSKKGNAQSSSHIPFGFLISTYIHLFQISGMILLVSMIGAIVLTYKKRDSLKRQSYIKQISRERQTGVELVDVKKNQGVRIDV